MKDEILDTNVILRYLVKDNEVQYGKAERIFKQAEKGERRLLIKPVVIAEAAFVLESFYKRTKEEIAEALEVFLSQKWLNVEGKEEMLSLWIWYRKDFHFVDSYLLSWAKINKGKILSFDKKLLRNF